MAATEEVNDNDEDCNDDHHDYVNFHHYHYTIKFSDINKLSCH